VDIANIAPEVTLSGSATANEGDTKSYSYTFTDPGADTWTHAVSCGAHGAVSNDAFSQATKSGSFDCTWMDNYVDEAVSATVNDDDGGTDTDTILVDIANLNPVVAKPAWSSASVACRVPATLTGISFSDAGVNDFPWAVDINWNNGPNTSYTTNTQGSQPNQSHTYNTPGTYTATVTVTDKDSGQGSNTSAALTVLQTYTVNFLQPFDNSTPSNLVTNTMKNGRVVPVKVTIYDDCAQQYVTDPAAVVKIAVGLASAGGGSLDAVETYADAGLSNAGTNLFRLADGFWIYNLDSKTTPTPTGGTLSMVTNSTYRVDVYVNGVKATVTKWALLKPVK
jgi:hypothetical protein